MPPEKEDYQAFQWDLFNEFLSYPWVLNINATYALSSFLFNWKSKTFPRCAPKLLVNKDIWSLLNPWLVGVYVGMVYCPNSHLLPSQAE
jgi:hypothetical protein